MAKVYQLYQSQALDMTIPEAWQFFSSPYNLNAITPEFFHVDILTPVPDAIYAGLMIQYSMKAVWGIPMTWLSEVSHCEAPYRFMYDQRVGPFKFLSHEVRLTKLENGIQLEDIIFYAMPLGWLGQFLNKILIGSKLEQIFNARHDYLESRWPASKSRN